MCTCMCVCVCVCVYESCWVQLVRKLYQTNNAVRGFLLSLSLFCVQFRHPHWLMSVSVDVVVYFESYYSILLDLELSAVHIHQLYISPATALQYMRVALYNGSIHQTHFKLCMMMRVSYKYSRLVVSIIVDSVMYMKMRLTSF